MGTCRGSARCASAASSTLSTPPLNSTSSGEAGSAGETEWEWELDGRVVQDEPGAAAAEEGAGHVGPWKMFGCPWAEGGRSGGAEGGWPASSWDKAGVGGARGVPVRQEGCGRVPLAAAEAAAAAA